jgi:hypothetical protein
MIWQRAAQMNKIEMVGLPGLDRGIDTLANIFSKKTVFATSKSTISVPAGYNVKDYFDLVIMDNLENLDRVGHPDIYLHNRPNIDSDGVVDIQRVFELKSTLICHKAVEQAKRLRLKPRNYMVSLPLNMEESIGAESFARFVQSANGEVADATVMLGQKDHMIEVYSEASFARSFDKYFKESDKYRVPVNLRSKNRKFLMEMWS